MDPISHAAFGRSLIALAWGDPKRRTLVIAGILGAFSPDIDAVFMPAGWDRYLRVHEIGTHTILGTILCGLLTAAVVRAYAGPFPSRQLAAAGWIGAASHVLLDLLSSARLRLFWPFVDRQFSVPLVAMADPWLALMLFVAAMACVIGSRHARARQAAAIGVALCAAFLVGKAAGAVRASAAYSKAARDQPADRYIVEAEWASLRHWRVFDRTSTHLRAWRADGISGRAELLLTWPLQSETPLVTASRSFSTVRNFLRAHGLGFAITVRRSPTENWVLWSDVRYCWRTRTRAPSDLTVRPAGDGLDCGLWFGGAFDRNRNPLLEVVQIGSFTQTRELR